ncbi:MAG: hypothetical protein OZ924_04155 [Burkholderiaceae bacterium]|nr:hypothetical protein [Burkholderiaceae bacterium]
MEIDHVFGVENPADNDLVFSVEGHAGGVTKDRAPPVARRASESALRDLREEPAQLRALARRQRRKRGGGGVQLDRYETPGQRGAFSGQAHHEQAPIRGGTLGANEAASAEALHDRTHVGRLHDDEAAQKILGDGPPLVQAREDGELGRRQVVCTDAAPEVGRGALIRAPQQETHLVVETVAGAGRRTDAGFSRRFAHPGT